MSYKKALTVLLVVVGLLYPLLVYLGLQYMDTRVLAAILLLLLAARTLLLLKQRKTGLQRQHYWLLAAVILAVGASLVTGSRLGLKFYPVLVNLCLLAVFAGSLFTSRSMVEHFARIKEPELSPKGIAYTRQVTKVWCLFFLVNGVIAGYTVSASEEVWVLYNGLISYVAITVLMVVEYLYRRRVRRLDSNT